MGYHSDTLHKGLDLMYRGELIALVGLIVGIFVLFIPVIGLILGLVVLLAALVGGIMSLVASFRLSREHRDYQTALVLLIARLACNLIERAVSGGGASVVLSVVQSVCSLGEIYFFIRATNSFLSQEGREDKVQQGRKVFMLQLIACVLSIVLGALLVVLAEDMTLLLVLALVIGVVAIVPAAFFIQYLKDSAAVFRPTGIEGY